MPSSPLGTYTNEICEFSLLNASEERDLGAASRRGDTEARDRLVMANLRLVISIAKEFTGRGLSLDDLVGEGNLGLIRAAKEFDPSFGTRFSTYASYWIKESIRRALITTTAPIRLPAHMVTLITKWRRAERDYLRQYGCPPTHEQIAAILGINEVKRRMIEQGLLAGRFIASESCEQDDSLSQAAAHQEGPEARIEAEEQHRNLLRRLTCLDAREQFVLTMHLGLDDEPPRSLKQISEVLGITREWVRKIEAKALEKLERFAGPMRV